MYNCVGDTFSPILKDGSTRPLDPFKASKFQIGLKGRYFDENRNEAPLFYFNFGPSAQYVPYRKAAAKSLGA